MTAAEAAKIVADLDTVDPRQVEAAVGDWHRLIEVAARGGKCQAFERDLNRSPATVFSRAVDASAVERLVADGYDVTRAADGEVVVSWPTRPATVEPDGTSPVTAARTIPPTE